MASLRSLRRFAMVSTRDRGGKCRCPLPPSLNFSTDSLTTAMVSSRDGGGKCRCPLPPSLIFSTGSLATVSSRARGGKCRCPFPPPLSFSTDSSSGGSSCPSSFRYDDLVVEVASGDRVRKKPDPSTLVFGESFSDHMFEAEWKRDGGWSVPRIAPLHHFQFHPASKVFHYAQAVFEGMKAFRRSDGSVALFRPELNVERLFVTAKRASLPLFDRGEFLKCLKRLVSLDKSWTPDVAGGSLYIRPTFIGTQSSLGVMSSNTALLYVICGPVGPYFPGGVMKPISLLADPSFVRAWPGGVGDKKMASNYAPSLYVQKLAQEQGLQQVLWLFGEEHRVCEVGAMNVFFLFQKGDNEYELATPSLDGTILPGVTRQSLIEIAESFGEFEVSERTITMGEIISANQRQTLVEMFVCGTACSVCPVSAIKFKQHDIKIPTMSRITPLYERLYKALADIQYGRVESDWSVKVD